MKIRALIFDDEEIILRLLKTVLMGRGYEVLSYHNPSTCPVHLENVCCDEDQVCADIIITDIKMPVVDGLTFLEKQKSKGCKVPNIGVISGYWSPDAKERAANLECKTFQKPFTLGQLEDWLDECEKNIEPNRILADI